MSIYRSINNSNFLLEGAKARLICFPCAGGGASAFKAWQNQLPNNIEILVAQLPGREEKYHQKHFTSWSELIECLLKDIKPYFDRPFFFYGHSLGGLISFEVAKSLGDANYALPNFLLIAGSYPPDTISKLEELYCLDEEQLLHKLMSLGGIPPEVLASKDLMDIFLQVIKGDLSLMGRYNFTGVNPIDTPIHTFGGKEDSKVSAAYISEWKKFTKKSFTITQLPGDHFFVKSSSSTLLFTISQLIIEDLEDKKGEK